MPEQPNEHHAPPPRLHELVAPLGAPRAAYVQTEARAARAARYDARVGSLTHQVLATCVDGLRDLAPVEQRWLLRTTVDALPRDRGLGRGDKARFTVDGYCLRYLDRYLPPNSVRFLGGNTPLGTGRVDLLWQTQEGLVFADEIKTSRRINSGIDSATDEQIRRYLRDGAGRYGSDFIGVRLLTLGSAGDCRWISSDGTSKSLTTQPWSADMRDSA